MDHHTLGMAQKRARHFNEFKTVVSVALMIFGACACFTLVMIWPQSYLIKVFNSKLAYHLILDVEDYFTCDNEYVQFVVDEPDASFSMFTVFVFNVTNTADVIQRGNKPDMLETGPYGFVKYTYKYDISFDDPVESTTVTFKEFSILQEVADESACENMYFRMDRDSLQASPCTGGSCLCKSYDSLVTIINPLLLKMLWDESPSSIISHHAVEVFTEIKRILEDPFTEAVKAHLVSRAYQEIYMFRSQMQAGKLLVDSVDYLVNTKQHTIEQIIGNQTYYKEPCGLAAYGISTCPFNPFPFLYAAQTNDIALTDYPSVGPLLNRSITANASVLDQYYGMPRLLGMAWVLEIIQFNALIGYSSVTEAQMNAVVHNYTVLLAEEAFGAGTYTADQYLGSRRMLTAFLQFVVTNYINPYASKLQSLVYTEFLEDYAMQACHPLGELCRWQFGYLKHFRGVNTVISAPLELQLIDTTTMTNTNPTNLFKDFNAPKWYNSYRYCMQVRNYAEDLDISCTNLDTTYFDATVSRPAGLWGKENGKSTDNVTILHGLYNLQSAAVKSHYFELSCNLSYLIHEVYRDASDFHDNFVISFINKYKDPLLKHNFTVGNWTDLGLAQFGGGFITQALAKVRATNMIVRDGMWRIGQDNYYVNFLEYSSWAVKQGYPQAWIYTVDEARTLLHSLARRDSIGVELRRHIVYQATTYFGDGVNFIRGVGALGDVTFVKEANKNNFTCTGSNEVTCTMLDQEYVSSAAHCQAVEDLYLYCVDQFNFQNNKWVDLDQCYGFQTSKTSDSLGIQCEATKIFGNDHPYRKTMGHIVFQMMWSLTVKLELLEGLWCSAEATCQYMDGGLFATTTVRKLLFEGYTEPSVLKYMDLKHAEDSIGVECQTEPFDICGKKRYKCISTGMYLTLPDSSKKLLRYGETPNEEYFAPYFIITADSELLWPYAINETAAEYARNKMLQVSYTEVRNPHWAAYPAWTANDTAFNKHYQCQKRLFGGEPDLYNSCFDTLYTGRDNLDRTLNIKALHGNTTIFPYGNGSAVNGSSINNQYEPELWPGFQAYPYSYLGLTAGVSYPEMTAPTLFSKMHGMTFSLYQKSLIFEFQRQLTMQFPLKTGMVQTASPVQSLPARRFVEDSDTWDPHRALGTSHDSYGMPFRTPLGMASLERYANFPVFTGTPHQYGNRLWGGIEYTLVTGTVYERESQRTYVDYDPVTGRAIRSALRQQINVRIESGPMFPNILSSQQRCVVPTATFAASSGYGCFAYVPVFWFEEARTVDTETFFRFYDHYYTRPVRASALTFAGITFGLVFMIFGACLFINEAYHRRKFGSRVYVD